MKKALTPDQARERLRSNGKTVSQWAREHGFRIQAVYRVLGGQDKAYYGNSHAIAVALGLKVPDGEPSTAVALRNKQDRAAA